MTTMNGAAPVKAVPDAPTAIWQRSHYLNKMDLRQLVVAYFQYYTIRTYLVIAALALGVAIWSPPTLVQAAGASVFVMLVYPLVWYCLHRWVLHSQWMWKVPFLAKSWKRIHYDHHQDPNHLEILFGSLGSELPPVFIMTLPFGYAIGGVGGAAVALATGVLTTCFYEFCHCIQHLSYKPKNAWLVAMKARHMAHHFHDESGNFGITNFAWDRLFGTFYERIERPNRSATVFNLGYTEDVAARYPWVARLSGGVASGHPRQRDRAAKPSANAPERQAA
jgi:sterol desaturase/sphingolipid hydroxylase (fatty acid hydroxylase superfamily)